jgi:methionyl-tRNA formyltransferase
MITDHTNTEQPPRHRVVFMGTPDFAVAPLHALIETAAYQVVGVITQPDRPAGRGRAIQESPVKQAAVAADIPTLQPEKLRAPGVFEQLQSWQPDLIVVAAFGQILRQNVLDLPRFGCVNVHASLLPRWRGAAPIQAAIRAGDAETGITIMRMDAGLDTGPMLRARAIPITMSDTGESIHDKLAALGGELLIDTLGDYLTGQITPQSQDESLQTYAPMLSKDDGRIDWTQSAATIDRQVRAYDPWPGTFTIWDKQPLKVLRGSPLPGTAASGQVLQITKNGFVQIAVGTGEGLFGLNRIQLAGRGAVEAEAFSRGYPAFLNARLGE